MNTITKAQLIDALRGFIESRPGFDPANYGSFRDLRADQRRATRQLHDARAMLAYIDGRDSITAQHMLFAMECGRLTWDAARGQLDYTTGQYYPTEYRGGACLVLASAVWDWLRDECLPPAAGGDAIRAAARRELGRSITARWFV